MATKLLKVYSPETLTFSKAQSSHEITISNVSNVDVTFKLQSSVFGKFRMSPRCGILKPKDYTHVLITMLKDAELSKRSRDKILVICMTAPINEVDFNSTASFWRHNICYNPAIEKHQLTCRQEQDDANESMAGESIRSSKEPKEGSVLRARTVAAHWR